MLALAVKKGVPQRRTVLLPNWVDTAQIHPIADVNPLRAEFSIPAGTKVVLYHGNMGRKQGLETVIAAATQLSAASDILFLLCGEGPARAELQLLAQALPNVRFIGLQPEDRLNFLVNLADVHVLPQRAEAADLVMPSKLTTMLASGKPVIACAAPGTQLWQVVSQVGVTVEPESPGALASAILALIHDPAECARLGKLGRLYACEYLEKEIVLGKFMKDLDMLLHPT
jgi:colanic acid biosynthesis glycosyl transferase WcaI